MLLLRNHSLHDSRAVTENRKKQFARLAQIVKPAANGDGAARVRARLLDRDDRNWCLRFLDHVAFPMDYLPRIIMACTSCQVVRRPPRALLLRLELFFQLVAGFANPLERRPRPPCLRLDLENK